MPAVYTFEVTRTVTCKVTATTVEEAAEKSKLTIGAVNPGQIHGSSPELTVTDLTIKRVS